MSIITQAKAIIRARPVAHRPDIPVRYWFYIAAAYLIPVVAQIGFPADDGVADELVWLITLAPAFLLALHYGLAGSFSALVFGTALFLVVQVVLAQMGAESNIPVTVPTYIAYGALAISVGWLSEQLHEHYQERLSKERMTAIGELVVSLNHEINNALTPLINETDLLLTDDAATPEERAESLNAIKESARRITTVLERLTRLEDTPVKTYLGNTKMLDLEGAPLRSGMSAPMEDGERA